MHVNSQVTGMLVLSCHAIRNSNTSTSFLQRTSSAVPLTPEICSGQRFFNLNVAILVDYIQSRQPLNI